MPRARWERIAALKLPSTFLDFRIISTESGTGLARRSAGILPAISMQACPDRKRAGKTPALPISAANPL
jgi:hypothetical protein